MGDPAVLPKAAELLSTGRPGWERALLAFVLRHTYAKKLKAKVIGQLPPKRIHELLFGHLASIWALLAAGPWLVGSAKSMADIAVSAQIDEIVRTSPLAPRVLACPRLSDWLVRCA